MVSKKGRGKKVKTKTKSKKSGKSGKEIENALKRKIESMTLKELRELVLINTYKISIMRAQIEALTELLKDKKILNYESFWKKTKKYVEESLM